MILKQFDPSVLWAAESEPIWAESQLSNHSIGTVSYKFGSCKTLNDKYKKKSNFILLILIQKQGVVPSTESQYSDPWFWSCI